MRDIQPVLSIFDSFSEADAADRQYFWSLTPVQRLEFVEELRRRTYGEARVLEIAERS